MPTVHVNGVKLYYETYGQGEALLLDRGDRLRHVAVGQANP
jgi:hypothetical protein